MPKGSAYRTTPRGRRGRFARAEMTEAEAKSVGVQARMRVFGISEDAANTNAQINAGTAIGRMHFVKALTQDQLDTAVWFSRERASYLRAIQARGEASPSDGVVSYAEDSDSYEKWVKAKRQLWQEIQETLRELQNTYRADYPKILDWVLVRDIELPHFRSDLLVALNALHNRFLRGKK